MKTKECNHHKVYFENGRLTCYYCHEDVTPPPNVRTVYADDDYREKILKDIEKICNDLPDDILHDIELYAEYLKWRPK